MSEDTTKNTNDYQTAFEEEFEELVRSREKLFAFLTEKKGMESFLSKSTLEMIRKFRGEQEVVTKGEVRDVVIMFTDVRGFTRFSEVFGVEKVFEIINSYLSVQSKNIADNHGGIDKFLGDGIMAIFEDEQKEFNALRAAIEIQNSIGELNYAYTQRAVLDVGIGIHTGQVFMGVLGEEGRKDYTAIGDNVNIASRLCSQAKGGEILFTDQFRKLLPDMQGIKFRKIMQVKGKRTPLHVYHYELDVGYPEIRQRQKPTGEETDSTIQHFERKESKPKAKRGLTPKEKELVAVGASIVSGCQRCADYHFVKVFEAGATVEEVRRAVHEALEMIGFASEVMQQKVYTLMDIQRKGAADAAPGDLDRISLLVRIGAVVALNNITGIAKYIELALQRGMTPGEIQMATVLAKIVAAKAREFAADKILKALNLVSHASPQA